MTKLRLSEAGNTYTPALQTLKSMGYALKREDESWTAIKDERIFSGSDPLVLLGLVTLWEKRGDDWQRKEEEENLYFTLI